MVAMWNLARWITGSDKAESPSPTISTTPGKGANGASNNDAAALLAKRRRVSNSPPSTWSAKKRARFSTSGIEQMRQVKQEQQKVDLENDAENQIQIQIQNENALAVPRRVSARSAARVALAAVSEQPKMRTSPRSPKPTLRYSMGDAQDLKKSRSGVRRASTGARRSPLTPQSTEPAQQQHHHQQQQISIELGSWSETSKDRSVSISESDAEKGGDEEADETDDEDTIIPSIENEDSVAGDRAAAWDSDSDNDSDSDSDSNEDLVAPGADDTITLENNLQAGVDKANQESGESGETGEGGSERRAHDEWRNEQVLLSAILQDQLKYSLIPSTWAYHFRGVPLPDGLFYTKVKESSSRPRIYARTEKLEYRGAQTLRKLGDIAPRIRELRISQHRIIRDRSKTYEQKRDARAALGRDMVRKLRAALEDAIAWSRIDGGLVQYGRHLPHNIHIFDVSGTDSSYDEIHNAMAELAAEWRARMLELARDDGAGSSEQEEEEEEEDANKPKEPVIYGLAIMSHIVLVVTMDASNPDASCHIPTKFNMDAQNQSYWHALAIMATICWARDKLMVTAQDMGLDDCDGVTESDPDA